MRIRCAATKLKTMSKIEAFKCDNCGTIVEYEDCVGIKPVEDMFDKQSSYPSISNPSKCEIHMCVSGCYNKFVLIPASHQVKRNKNNEAEYKAKLKELAYGLRSQTVAKWRAASRNKS